MRIVSILYLLLLVSCNSQNKSDEDLPGDTTFITIKKDTPFNENPPEFKNLIWAPIFDSAKGNVIVKRQRMVSADTLSAQKLIAEINGAWDGIKLELRKISHDTIFVAIPQSTVLTQQMGSSGANNYMFSTTYTLTELPNIKFVNFDFMEGDHLAPGTMKRSDFANQ